MAREPTAWPTAHTATATPRCHIGYATTRGLAPLRDREPATNQPLSQRVWAAGHLATELGEPDQGVVVAALTATAESFCLCSAMIAASAASTESCATARNRRREAPRTKRVDSLADPSTRCLLPKVRRAGESAEPRLREDLDQLRAELIVQALSRAPDRSRSIR